MDYYYIIRDTGNAESILIEYGFIDNKNDANKLENNLTDFAEGVVKAIAEYLGVPYTPPGQYNTTNMYTVKKGDTLYSISKKTSVPIDTIIRLNNLTSSSLKIGQKLKLSEDNSNETPIENTDIYQVERGDTLYSIALKYNTNVDTLKKINNLSSNTLSIGQKILVPKDSDIKEDDYDLYIVQRGDSLWSISRKFNITVNDLIELNNLKNLTLQPNQGLLVPKQENTTDIPSNVYIVQKGDTLWSISSKLNIPVQTLKELNNITSNLLSVGQQLIVQ